MDGLFGDEDREPQALLEEGPSYAIVPPASLQRLESMWYGRIGTSLDDDIDPNELFPPGYDNAADWLDLLTESPSLLNSLDVLDDVVDIITRDLDPDDPLNRKAVQPLLDHAAWLLDPLLKKLPEGAQLSWGLLESRPALRLLYHRAIDMEATDPRAAAAEMERVLALCPVDNMGVRMQLMNLYLRLGENERAVALGEKYPSNVMPDLPFGRALALYRLGRQADATRTLLKAHRALPKVVDYLVAVHKRQPELDPISVRHGGGDQAWRYREAMREIWNSTPGALDWLTRHSR